MDYPDYTNTQDYLKGLYDTARRSQLARAASAESPDSTPSLLTRLSRRGQSIHPGGPGRDQFEDGYLTLTLHIG